MDDEGHRLGGDNAKGTSASTINNVRHANRKKCWANVFQMATISFHSSKFVKYSEIFQVLNDIWFLMGLQTGDKFIRNPVKI